jgi:excisionase family DNA binding protein
MTEPGGTAWLSVPQAARHLGISERAVRKRIAAHSLPAQRDGGGPWRVRVGTTGAAVPEPPKVGTTEPDAAPPPGALVTAGDDWRAVQAAKDQVIAAQAATISAQSQTIAALLATRAAATGQERASDSPGTPEPSTVARHDAPGMWGRLRRRWRDTVV